MGLSFSDADTLKKVGSSLAILAVLAAIIYGIYYFKNKSSFGGESSSYKDVMECNEFKIMMVLILSVIAFYFYKKNKGSSAFGRRRR
jgi:hypothetical protein